MDEDCLIHSKCHACGMGLAKDEIYEMKGEDYCYECYDYKLEGMEK